MVFVNLEKEYDRVSRNLLWKALKKKINTMDTGTL